MLDCGKNAFREAGGLDFLMELVSSTDSTLLLEHLLRTLAFVVDENVHNQTHMTKTDFFSILQLIVRKPTFPEEVFKYALLLTSSILFQNGLAQSLIFESGLLQDLVSLYSNFATSYVTSDCNKSKLNDSSVDVWISVNSLLCFAVNNPQNEKNQEVCSILIPLCLKSLESSFDNKVNSSISSFLSLCIANNAKNQEKFAEFDGIIALKRCFQKHFDSLMLDVKEFGKVVSKNNVNSINYLIGIINSVTSENGKNSAFLGEIGVLNLMVELLTCERLDTQLEIRIILSLASCIDAHRGCKSYVLQYPDFHNVLRKNFQTGVAELISASKYLLLICLNEEVPGTLPRKESYKLQDYEDDHSDVFPSVSDSDSVKSECVVTSPNIYFENEINKSTNIKSSLFDKQTPSKKQTSKMADDRSNKSCLHLPGKSSNFLNKFKHPFTDFKIPLKIDDSQICKSKKSKRHSKSHSASSKRKLSRNSGSVKSCTNSKHESILFCTQYSDNKIQNHTNRKSTSSYKETFDKNCKVLPLNSNTLLQHQESFQKHKTSSQHLFSPFKKLKHSDSKIVDQNGSSRSMNYSASVINENSGQVSNASQVYKNIERDFNPFFKSITDETKNKIYPTSNIGCDIFRDILNLHKSFSFDKNSATELQNKPLVNVSDKKSENKWTAENDFYLNDFQIPSDVFDPTSNTLEDFNFDLSENLENSDVKDAVSPDKKIKKKKRKSKKRNNSTLKGEAEHSGKDQKYFQKENLESYVQVIVMPGDSCVQHQLMSSFEMLKVTSLEESTV